jgi:hypothetical protein
MKMSHAVLVDSVVYTYEERESLLEFLEQHITENLIKAILHMVL